MLKADLDASQPLLLGREPIVALLTEVYTRIFADPNDWFRTAFTNIDDVIIIHIKAQSNYWIDDFGGGRMYWGGLSHVGFHHHSGPGCYCHQPQQ